MVGQGRHDGANKGQAAHARWESVKEATRHHYRGRTTHQRRATVADGGSHKTSGPLPRRGRLAASVAAAPTAL